MIVIILVNTYCQRRKPLLVSNAMTKKRAFLKVLLEFILHAKPSESRARFERSGFIKTDTLFQFFF